MKSNCFLFLISLQMFISGAYAACNISIGFEGYNKATFKGDAAPAKDPVEGLNYISPDQAKQMIKDKDNFVFIDTRPAAFFNRCRIKNSVNHPFKNSELGGELTKEIVQGYVNQGKRVVFYCNALKCHRSLNAAIQSVCNWSQPAESIKWFGMGIPGIAKVYRRGVKGTSCESFL